MYIPTELLTCIASELNSIDLSSFRLVNRRFGQAGISLIPKRGFSVINITRDIEELRKILKISAIASNVKTLRIFHAEWPICSHKEWETHHLLFGGNGRIQARKQSEKAFAAYKKFITEQQHRRYSDEIEGLFQVFSMLPNLTVMQISAMHDYLWHPTWNRRFHTLQESIWISPFYSQEVTRTVEAVLVASGPGMAYLPQLRALHVSGSFDPRELHIDHTSIIYSHIQHLKIYDFRISENERLIQRFLGAFPQLLTLSVSFQGYGPTINTFKSLFWERLQRLNIRGMWTSESEFADILKRHENTLRYFRLQDGALTEGSWQNLLTKIRETQTQIALAGELYGRTRRETLDMECAHVRSQIERFLENRQLSWPFKNITG